MCHAWTIVAVLTLTLAELAVGAPADASPADAAASPAEIIVYRPAGCKPGDQRLGRRTLWQCEREERQAVHPTDRKAVPRPLAAVAARNPYPVELTRVWRTCPLASIAAFDAAADVWAPYSDLDVSQCYVWAPFDSERLGRLKRGMGPAKLDDLHPYFAAVMRRMVVFAAERGWDLRVASAWRKNSARPVVSKERVRKNGKWVTVRKVRYRIAKGMHAWGMACDVLFLEYKSLKVATRDYLRDPVMRARWDALVEFGERHGLFWLGHEDKDEIVHFEFHPGWPSYPTGAQRKQILATERAWGHRAVWRLLRPADDVAPALAHLRDPR